MNENHKFLQGQCSCGSERVSPIFMRLSRILTSVTTYHELSRLITTTRHHYGIIFVRRIIANASTSASQHSQGAHTIALQAVYFASEGVESGFALPTRLTALVGVPTHAPWANYLCNGDFTTIRPYWANSIRLLGCGMVIHSAVLQFAHDCSIEVVVLVVLSAGRAYVKCEALFGQLIHPDTFGDRRSSRHCAALFPRLGCGG